MIFGAHLVLHQLIQRDRSLCLIIKNITFYILTSICLVSVETEHSSNSESSKGEEAQQEGRRNTGEVIQPSSNSLQVKNSLVVQREKHECRHTSTSQKIEILWKRLLMETSGFKPLSASWLKIPVKLSWPWVFHSGSVGHNHEEECWLYKCPEDSHGHLVILLLLCEWRQMLNIN